MPTLAEDFWDRVTRLLTEEHRIPRSDARKWTDRYRRELKHRGIGDAVYNRGEELAAATIAAAIEHGKFPEPVPA